MKHLAIVAEALAEPEGPDRADRRSTRWQKGRRTVERSVRMEAVEYGSFVVLEGGTIGEAAGDLDLSTRTLEDWRGRARKGTLEAEPRGRPLKDSGRMLRNEVISFIETVGPGVGVGRLEGVFPEVPRCEVASVLWRYRGIYIRKNLLLIHELEWTMPGAVWAMDHAKPPAPIEGRYRAIFAVRDLASGEQILWHPVESEGAHEVVGMLDVRFEIDGAPLVMKDDNGSGFIAEETQGALSEHGVTQLLSPPRFPPYNGSIESGIGAMKDRTTWSAARRGRPLEWTGEDLESARIEANELPRGVCQPSAGEVWRARSRITPELRAAFQATVFEEETRERAAWGLAPGAVADPKVEAEIKRTAISRALVAHGILRIRRRWIPLPKRLLKRAKIS
ncbi:MAG: transposase family protein [Planctomycetota bacterium]